MKTTEESTFTQASLNKLIVVNHSQQIISDNTLSIPELSTENKIISNNLPLNEQIIPNVLDENLILSR